MATTKFSHSYGSRAEMEEALKSVMQVAGDGKNCKFTFLPAIPHVRRGYIAVETGAEHSNISVEHFADTVRMSMGQ